MQTLEGTLTREEVQLFNTIDGNVPLRNEMDSPFGAGWCLSELDRIYVNPEGSLLLASGDGETHVLNPGGKLVDRTALGLLDPEWGGYFRSLGGVLTGTFDSNGETFILIATSASVSTLYRLEDDNSLTTILNCGDFISYNEATELYSMYPAIVADLDESGKLYMIGNNVD